MDSKSSWGLGGPRNIFRTAGPAQGRRNTTLLHTLRIHTAHVFGPGEETGVHRGNLGQGERASSAHTWESNPQPRRRMVNVLTTEPQRPLVYTIYRTKQLHHQWSHD